MICHVTAAAAAAAIVRQLAGKMLPVLVIVMLGTLEMGRCSSATKYINYFQSLDGETLQLLTQIFCQFLALYLQHIEKWIFLRDPGNI